MNTDATTDQVSNRNHAIDWDAIVLRRGSHDAEQTDCGRTPEACLWEALNYERQGRITHACPPDVSRILHSLTVSLNDLLPEDRRQELKRFRGRMFGTAGQPGADERAGYLCLDWLIRTYTPAWLRLAGLAEHADALTECDEIADLVTAGAVADQVREAQAKAAAAWDAAGDAARDAAGAAAGDAAGDAAWDAARDAAGDAARDAAGAAARAAARAAAGAAARDAARAAARAAAGDAAWDAARDAAGDAARDAAGDRLAPTVTELQSSVLALLDRILDCYGTEPVPS